MIFCKKREADQDHTKHLKDRFPISTALLLISFHALAKVQPLSLVDLQTHPEEGQAECHLMVRRYTKSQISKYPIYAGGQLNLGFSNRRDIATLKHCHSKAKLNLD